MKNCGLAELNGYHTSFCSIFRTSWWVLLRQVIELKLRSSADICVFVKWENRLKNGFLKKKLCSNFFFFGGNHCVVNFNVNFNISESDSSPPQYMCYQIMVKCVLLEDLQVDICVSVKWENCLKNDFLKKF